MSITSAASFLALRQLSDQCRTRTWFTHLGCKVTETCESNDARHAHSVTLESRPLELEPASREHVLTSLVRRQQ